MDKAFNARGDLDERAVVSEDDNLTFHYIANLEVRIECVPRMRCELLETEGDTLLAVIEVEDDDFDLLVELYDFFRIVDAAL